jgi:hypothetical protein
MKRYKQLKPIEEKINYIKLVLENAINFFKEKLHTNVSIKLHIHNHISSKTYGYIPLGNKIESVYDLYIEKGAIDNMIKNIAHEITHIKQKVYHDLFFKDNYIYWKNKPYMSIEEYNKITYTKWKILPWEKEADTNREILFDAYLKSKQFKELKNSNDPTIEFIADNIEI